MRSVRMTPIQSGARTHSHDQSITWVSLSTMNTIARSPQNPTPPDELLEDDEFLLMLF